MRARRTQLFGWRAVVGRAAWLRGLCAAVLPVFVLGGCPGLEPPPSGDGNGDGTGPPADLSKARYIGSDACATCHPGIADQHYLHGHAWKLNKTSGVAPAYPAENAMAVVPSPPDGRTWADIRYVIGGYFRKARFIDAEGFVMTDGVDGVHTQWNLDFAPAGTPAGWTAYHTEQTTPKEYAFSCFQCHTTGPESLEDGGGRRQDGLPGITGTFAEPGVQCEACHGPGSLHPPDPLGGTIVVDNSAALCGRCHTRGDDDTVIAASGGYIRHHEQYPELLNSPHAQFECVVCHAPHASTIVGGDGLRNQCTQCHGDYDAGSLHEGAVFVRGSHTEPLDCESCHMPYATKSAAAASEAVVGVLGRAGDIRTHIFRVRTDESDFAGMFSEDGSRVVGGPSGRVGVTLDFVCLRCHNDVGNAFGFDGGLRTASGIASGYHEKFGR